MSKTIVVVGFGPGISTAVAERFGAEGFSVALVARNKERLAAGVAALKAKGIAAAAFEADAGDPGAVGAAIAKARAALGAITIVQWNAYGGADVGDLLTAEPGSVRGVFDVAVVGLIAAVQAALPAFGEVNPQVDAYAVSLKAMGLALANGAKNKLVGLLSERLKGDGVYVGEVMVAGTVKSATSDGSRPTIEPSAIADQFWALYRARGEVRARIS
jgi:NAD(P)-dependent dehydrogenase (short-subunit alcohol dehydrogenase family)